MLGDNSPCCLYMPGDSFCCRLSFQCLYSKQHWKIEIELPSGAEGNLFADQASIDNVSLEGKGWADLPAAPL